MCLTRDPRRDDHSALLGDVTNSGKLDQMNNIFWLIGVIVVVLLILSFLGLR
jgi:hypothetical protein